MCYEYTLNGDHKNGFVSTLTLQFDVYILGG